MCGIGGWLGHVPHPAGLAARMLQHLHRRGPDAQGVQHWPEATLVHTRLSILDLSPSGAQPMASADGSIWTVFNGEIYNHRALRQQLAARGQRFRGHADTEVLPYLYAAEGFECVHRLQGMFALAIYDTRTRTLLLARDRFGIKPLFYAPGQDCLLFASSIPALKHATWLDLRPDTQAIADFTALSYIPAPATAYQGIRALQPGELLYARLDGNRLCWRTQTYHRWRVTPQTTLTLPQAVEHVEGLLQHAVQSQLESDVPLGAMLSGGIDSSLVSSVAQRQMGQPLQTFNVRFAEQAYDETWAATAVAHHIGSTHLTLDLNPHGASWEALTRLLQWAGQPFADTSLFAAHAVCQRMRQHVTVALSGDGGDEGFGGYDLYWQLARLIRCQRAPALFWRMLAQVCRPLSAGGLLPVHLPYRMQDVACSDDTALVQGLFCWLRADEHAPLCQALDALPLRRLFEPQWDNTLPRTASRLTRLSAQATEVNTRLVLANDFLCKVDLASMYEGLEVRVPMLDEALFAFGLSLPHALKVHGTQGKRVLRAVAARWLPAAVVAKPKHGFGVPVDTWLTPACKAQIREEVLSSASPLYTLLPTTLYHPVVEAFCDNHPLPGVARANLYQRAMMFLALHTTLQADTADQGAAV